jgi:hypothetical protein
MKLNKEDLFIKLLVSVTAWIVIMFIFKWLNMFGILH